jgi:hypothetical protein
LILLRFVSIASPSVRGRVACTRHCASGVQA